MPGMRTISSAGPALQPPSLLPRSATRQFRSAQGRLWLLIAFLFFPMDEKNKSQRGEMRFQIAGAIIIISSSAVAGFFWPEPCLGGSGCPY